MLTAALNGCGGGGSSGGGVGSTSPTAQVTNPGQVNTATPTEGAPGTPTLTPVRTGSATGTRTPTPTPTRTVAAGSTATRTVPPGSTPTPAAQIIVPAGANLRSYVRRAPANAKLIVSPGTYAPLLLEASDLKGPITLLADVRGEITQAPAADVTIKAGAADGDAAVQLLGVADVTLDGFTFLGGNKAALLVIDSSAVKIDGCTIRRSVGHGVVFERADSSRLFNNVVYDNPGAGLRVLGSDSVLVINNTIFGNGADAVFIGKSGQAASSNLRVENNIINRNEPTGITVDAGPPSSLSGYFGNFNLNSDGYGPDTPIGDSDINGPGSASDPQFFAPTAGDFHLAASSPAVNAGGFDTDPELLAVLTTRTTQNDHALDVEPVDMGHHYLAPPTPTPTPRK